MVRSSYFRVGVFVFLTLMALDAPLATDIGRDDQDRLAEAARLQEAALLYQRQCRHCHGENGDGGGEQARAQHLAVTDFTTPAALVALTRESMRERIISGHGDATDEALSPSDVEGLVDYIREVFMLPAPRDDAGLGRRVYARTCSVCHGERGDGESWAKNSLDPPPRNFRSANARRLSRSDMVQAIGFGVPGTAMVGFRSQLSQSDVLAVVDYIRTTFMLETIETAALDHGDDEHGYNEPDGGLDQPFPNGLTGDPDRGRALYEINCVACHGRTGDGQGPRSAFMERKPRDFTAAGTRDGLNRPHLMKGISDGTLGTEMPAWSKVLSGQEIADIAEYVLQRFVLADVLPAEARHGDADAGEALFDRHCYFCHGYRGDAETLASTMLQPPPRRLAGNRDLSKAQIERAIRHGRDGTAMTSFRGLLDDQEMADVAAFVFERLVKGSDRIGAYHTEANGWPDHRERYRQAFPFVLGEADPSASASELSESKREGQALFFNSCITCHEPKPTNQPVATLIRADGAELSSSSDWARRWHLPHRPPPPGDGEDHDEEYGRHDEAELDEPHLPHLTAIENQGRQLYRDLCVECHAADGSSQNWIGRFLEPNPPSLRHGEVASDRLANVILKGLVNTSMPAFESVLDQQALDALIAYLDVAIMRTQDDAH